MKPMNLFGHLEIGDALVINGIVRSLVEPGRALNLFTGPRAFPAVEKMYSDLPWVQVWWLTQYDEFKHPRWSGLTGGETIQLGYFAKQGGFDVSKWDQEFYRQAEVPFDHKWSRFHLPPEILKPAGERQNVALYHEDRSRGMGINPAFLPRNKSAVPIIRRSSFWDWLAEVQAASELHCIDSCFLNLADLLWAKGALRAERLVYHKYARKSPPPVLHAPWEIIQ